MEGNSAKGKVKRIPYGMMNFVAVREDDCYYVDKTRFIEKVENANKFFFFIRPRRFGKSLTISMLHHYYPKFDALLAVFPVFHSFAIFICGAVYYKLFSILIFLKGIFLYFSRS